MTPQAEHWSKRMKPRRLPNLGIWHRIWIHTSCFVVGRRRQYTCMPLIPLSWLCMQFCFCLKRTLPIITICRCTSWPSTVHTTTTTLSLSYTRYHDKSVETYASFDRKGVFQPCGGTVGIRRPKKLAPMSHPRDSEKLHKKDDQQFSTKGNWKLCKQFIGP